MGVPNALPSNIMGQNIPDLFRQQQDFIGGISPVALSQQFRPTLDALLQTGVPTRTQGAERAAESASGRLLEQATQNINTAQSAKGGGGSSAQSGQIARAGTELASRLGEEIARIKTTAEENATNRRLGSLSSALGEGQLGLQGDVSQARAGQDFLNMLKSAIPMGSMGVGRPALGQHPTVDTGARSYSGPSSISTTSVGGDRGLSSMHNLNAMNRVGKAHSNAQTVGAGFGDTQLSDMDRLLSNPAVMSMFQNLVGNTGGAQASNQLIAAGAEPLKALQQGGAAATAANAPMMRDQLMQQFMERFAQQYGPGFLGGVS